MVAKPLDFVATGPKGMVQAALKCRGREYLRIVYGPEYTADDQLPRLRKRGLAENVLSPIVSSLWELRRLNVLWRANHCAAFMNACSEYWRSRVNLSIHGCEYGKHSRLYYFRQSSCG
jgi:hypothetical protein